MNESVIQTITRLIDEKFTGKVTIHMASGIVKEIEEQKRWRPPREDETVDIVEGRKRA